MTADVRRCQLPGVGLFGIALAHALVTWPLARTLALFAGGAAIAMPLEAVGVRAGLLRHRFRPRVAGVPLTVVVGWPTVVYLAYRVALAATARGIAAAALAAALATLWDLIGDPVMVRRGAWTYPESPLSRPRLFGVPWWNFLAWPCVAFATASLAVVAG